MKNKQMNYNLQEPFENENEYINNQENDNNFYENNIEFSNNWFDYF